ncbi:MAG: 23S rRNA (guanosine(2251)-2'-O)-methyltransferase RlmB [Acidobacteria bacterium]|nr:23S rRNA (guanosine(2251)-2'-O)-methyltransferase RlmB [Acidobacteriota bacterium]
MAPIVVAGVHPVREALRAGSVRDVCVGARTDARVTEIVRLAEARGVPVRRVDAAELERLAGGERHQGVVATLGEAPRRWTLEQLVAVKPAPLVVVLDGVEDPHNVGAILRTVDAAGATGVVRQERHAAALGPAVARASAGALAHVRICDVVNVVRAIETLKSLGVWVVGLDAEGAQAYDSVDFRPPTALVVGAEGEGLRRLVREHCDFIAALPMRGHVGSLNVSVATGIVLYEALRQRGVLYSPPLSGWRSSVR